MKKSPEIYKLLKEIGRYNCKIVELETKIRIAEEKIWEYKGKDMEARVS